MPGKRLLRRIAFVALTAMSAGPVLAESGLYDAPLPPDSAFLRTIGHAGGTGGEARLDGRPLGAEAGGLSAYRVLPAGRHRLAQDGREADLALPPNSFTTLVLGRPDGPFPVTVEDAALKNPARAGLTFYNLSDASVTLSATIGGKSAPVFEGVATGAAAFRELNALDVALAVASEGTVQASLAEPVALKRQGVVAVVFFGPGALIARAAAIER